MSIFDGLVRILLIATGTNGSPTPSDNSRGDTSSIQWGPCSFNGTTPIDCGKLAVPLDYTDPQSETFELSLVRSKATNGTSKGSILFNFGGPGYEAINTLAQSSALIHSMTGGQNDLIAFDPRGTTLETIPLECFSSQMEREISMAKYTPLPSGASDVADVTGWAQAQAFSNVCAESNAKTLGGLVGTSFVARDLMSVVDALDEDGLLRYWGLSYGTVLGATVSAMFPDRMDKIVLDGVVNAHNYYHRYGIDIDQALSSDLAFRTVLEQCIEAGPEVCALASINDTALALESSLYNMVHDFREQPVAVGKTIFDYQKTMELLLLIIKYPTAVPSASRMIANLYYRENMTATAEYYNKLMTGVSMTTEALYGIKCGDAFPRATSLSQVQPDLDYMMYTSRLFGDSLNMMAFVCATWPFEAKERYSGDFNVKTRNPVLFIGNTYDPVTPVHSAYNMSTTFEGSRVVERTGFGHGSILGDLSPCTNKALQDYFVNGIVPDKNIVCEVETPLFPAPA